MVCDKTGQQYVIIYLDNQQLEEVELFCWIGGTITKDERNNTKKAKTSTSKCNIQQVKEKINIIYL